MAESNRNLYFRCTCGAKVEAVWKNKGLFGKKHWVAEECPVCHRKADLSGAEVIACPHCRQIVLKTESVCIECGQPLSSSVDNKPIPCPHCSVDCYLPLHHQGDYTCAVCQGKLTKEYIEKIRREADIPEGPAQLIRLPDVKKLLDDGLVVYKHPVSQFSFKSRLQVNEGTYALMLQNGVCQYPCAPGSYLLEESTLRQEERFDAALNGSEVVFNTDLYCVRKILPELAWRQATVAQLPGEDGAPARTYQAVAGGTIRYQVDDARAFAMQVGFRQLTEKELCDPGTVSESAGWLKERTNGLMAAAYDAAVLDVFAQGVDPLRTDAVRQRLTDGLTAQLNPLLETDGLCVGAISVQELILQETEESILQAAQYKAMADSLKEQNQQIVQRCEEILKVARTQLAWTADDVEVHLKDAPQLTAALSFSGVCRLQVLDEQTFFDTPEISRFVSGDCDASAYFGDKLNALMRRHLSDVAQEFISAGRIDPITDRYAYRVIREPVADALASDLAREGLGVQLLSIDMPSAIRPSKALEDHLSAAERREQIVRCAERELSLRTEPILVHMKDDPTVYKKTVFTAKAYMRVIDRDTFFGTSEVKGFMEGESVPQAEVTAYYANRINLLFSDSISRVVQAVVDETNADIRELNRLNAILHDRVEGDISRRAYSLGMGMQSLDLQLPMDVEKSHNLLAWKEMHSVRSGAALGEEIDRIRNNRIVFDRLEQNRVDIANAQSDGEKQLLLDALQMRGLDSADLIAEKQAELEQREAERAHQAQAAALRRKDELQQLTEKAAADHAEHNFEEVRKQYQHKYMLREAEIEQGIREEQLRQQGRLDAAAREERARFDSELNTAENKRLLGSILHKIDESDLDWRQKLDEYDRLCRRLTVEDQAWADVTAAKAQAEKDQTQSDAQEKIRRDQNETALLLGSAKIQLDAAEAELVEKIARLGEERDKRNADSAAERQERKALLDFEQRMRDRQELLAQDMERLAQQHAHELALRDRDNQLAQQEYELKKLQFTLEHLTRETVEKAGVEKARFHAHEEIKKAQAQFFAQHETEKRRAEEERTRQQWQREDELAQRAAEYHKMMTNIQLIMEKLRIDNERNRDDRQADVAIAQAQERGKETRERLSDIHRSLDRLGDNLDRRCKEMQHEMEKIITSRNTLQNNIKGSKSQKAQPEAKSEAQSSGNDSKPAASQPVLNQQCPHCGVLCSAGAIVCDNCRWPL